MAAVGLSIMLVPVPSEATGASTSSDTSATNEACAEGGTLIGHSRPHLTGFTAADAVSPFYAALESVDPSVTLTVTPADQCSGMITQAGRAQYVTGDGSATSPGDFTAIGPPAQVSGEMCVEIPPAPPHDVCPAGSTPTRQVSLNVADDTITEPAVESFLFDIVGGTPFPPATFRTTEAPVHIIDDDGPARVSLEPTLEGSSTLTYARREPSIVDIPVFWAGTSGPSGPVHYTVSPGTPSPTLNVDYQLQSLNPLPVSAFTAAGGRLAFIRIRILNNAGADGKPAKEMDEIINVSLDPDPAYQVEAAHDSTTLTILDGGSDTIAPRTRFHHPRHKKKYSRNAYQLREMHVFYNRSEEVYGSGIKRVHLAISRKKKNGKCQWWNGNRFRGGRCKPVPGKFWKRTKYDRFLDWFLYRVPAFKPTQGTKIRFYRAYSRGIDHAGNVESRFIKKRNKNTFWIKRR